MSAARPGIDVVNVAVRYGTEQPCTALYRCPGCGRTHALGINNAEPGRPNWTWNGDALNPVFSPSVLYTSTWKGSSIVCHSFVGCNGAQPGEAVFLSDCTHANVGKTLRLVPWINSSGNEGWDEDDSA